MELELDLGFFLWEWYLHDCIRFGEKEPKKGTWTEYWLE